MKHKDVQKTCNVNKQWWKLAIIGTKVNLTKMQCFTPEILKNEKQDVITSRDINGAATKETTTQWLQEQQITLLEQGNSKAQQLIWQMQTAWSFKTRWMCRRTRCKEVHLTLACSDNHQETMQSRLRLWHQCNFFEQKQLDLDRRKVRCICTRKWRLTAASRMQLWVQTSVCSNGKCCCPTLTPDWQSGSVNEPCGILCCDWSDRICYIERSFIGKESSIVTAQCRNFGVNPAKCIFHIFVVLMTWHHHAWEKQKWTEEKAFST